MTKKEMRSRLESELMFYMRRMFETAERFGYNDINVNDYRNKCQGILLAAQAVDIINNDEWTACMVMVNYALIGVPIDER